MDELLTRPARYGCLIAAGACALPLFIQMHFWLMGLLTVSAVLGVLTNKQWPQLVRFALTATIGGLVLASFDFNLGRDTGSAGLLAMLALKPFETHSVRDARSLLGFALFCPFTAFLQDQGPLTLTLCLPALLLSLFAWALLVQGTHWLPNRPSVQRLFRQAGTALLMALPMALAGFWLFPRLATPLWGLPEKSTGRMGLGDRMTPNEWLDVLVDESPALRAHFDGRAPSREQMYWRGPVLTNFDGEAWTRNRNVTALATPRIAAIGTTVSYDVAMEPTERRDLLLLDLPTSIPNLAQLNNELTAVSTEPIINLIHYQGESALSARFIDALNATEKQLALALPPNRNPRTHALAQQWHLESSDPIALTQRFLQWIRKDFIYTIAAPPVGFNATDDFLFETQQGFCQHFSSAYVVFMRAAGIPARVVTGYVGGHYNRVGDYWLVYRKDAHAWAEIWVEGRGWVRVDPTAAIAPENIYDTVQELQVRQGLAGQVLTPIFDTSDFLRRSWNNFVLGYDAARQKNVLRSFGLHATETWQLVLVFSIGSGLTLGLTLWLLLRQQRDHSDPLVKAWRAFVQHLGRAGFSKKMYEPPLSFADRIAKHLPSHSRMLFTLSQRYSNWRYANHTLVAEEKQALIHDLRHFRLPRNVRRRHGEPQ